MSASPSPRRRLPAATAPWPPCASGRAASRHAAARPASASHGAPPCAPHRAPSSGGHDRLHQGARRGPPGGSASPGVEVRLLMLLQQPHQRRRQGNVPAAAALAAADPQHRHPGELVLTDIAWFAAHSSATRGPVSAQQPEDHLVTERQTLIGTQVLGQAASCGVSCNAWACSTVRPRARADGPRGDADPRYVRHGIGADVTLLSGPRRTVPAPPRSSVPASAGPAWRWARRRGLPCRARVKRRSGALAMPTRAYAMFRPRRRPAARAGAAAWRPR